MDTTDMFFAYMLLGFCFLLCRFIWPLPCSKAIKCLLATLLLVISQYHFIQIQIFGTMFSPEIPRVWVIIMGCAFCTFVLLVVLTLLKDLLAFTLWLANKANTNWKKYSLNQRGHFILVLVISAGLSGFGVYSAIQVPKINKQVIYIQGWPEALNGLKVVQLTDLHISTLFPANWVKDVVEKVNDQNPDLILITGDFIDGTTKDRFDDVQPLQHLKSQYGTYGVLGNHEYYFDAQAWNDRLEQLGIDILNNEHRTVEINHATFTLAGVTDESARQFGFTGPNVKFALRNASKSLPIILMKHQPLAALDSENEGVDLQLSGHTHGGMILGLNQLAKYANQGFISGLYQLTTMQLYVSNGTALWNGFPIRLGVPAEITEFTIRPNTFKETL